MNSNLPVPPSGGPRDAVLVTCVALALLLHSVLLASLWRGALHGPMLGHGLDMPSHPFAMRVTMLKESARPAALAKTESPKASISMENGHKVALHAEAEHDGRSANVSSDQLLDLWPRINEGQVLINRPDAPLPGGWLRMRVLIELDAQGRIQTLEHNTGPEVSRLFFDAVQRGLSESTFSPGYFKQRAVASRLCLDVVFDEKSPVVKSNFIEDASGNREPCLGIGQGGATSKVIAAQPPP